MNRRWAWSALLLVPFLALGAGRIGLRLGGPHRVVPATARPTTGLLAQIDEAIQWKKATSAEEAVEAALEITRAALTPSLGHTTSFDFDVAERGGNCVEYAQLFVFAFNRGAAAAGLSARAVAVRSHDPRIFGARLPGRFFADHDWVMIRDGTRKLYVDPTFDDLWLGSNLANNVTGSPDEVTR